MKKYQKKLALMMAAMLLVSAIPTNAIATEEENTAIDTQSTNGEIDFTCGENATWKLEEGVLTISGTGDMYDYSSTEAAPWIDFVEQITSVVIEEGITTIGDYAFFGCTNLVTVENNATLTKVGTYAFQNCRKMTGITLGDSVESIGDYAFASCGSMNSVELPQGLKTIEAYTFYNVPLTEIVIPDGVATIEQNAFNGTRLTELKIPDSVESIGDFAFSISMTFEFEKIEIGKGVKTLGSGVFGGNFKQIIFGGDAPTYKGSYYSLIGKGSVVYYPKDNATWTEEVMNSLGKDVLWVEATDETSNRCGDNVTWQLSEEGVFIIAGTGDMWDYKPTNAMPWADALDEITTVVIEEGITTVGDYAFFGCTNLVTVENKATLTKVGAHAFQNCRKMTGITLGDSVESIGDYAFASCGSMNSVELAQGLKTIEAYTFYNVPLTEIVIPDGVATIEQNAFDGTRLTELKIPDSVESIGDFAFSISTTFEFEKIEIGKGVKTLGSGVFGNFKKIIFEGDAPTCKGSYYSFIGKGSVVYYPKNNTTWTDEVKLSLGTGVVFTPGLPIVQKETHSLTLNGDIGLNFYITPEEEYSIETGRMWIDGKEERHHQNGDKHSDGRVKFTAHTAAAEMSKPVYYEYDGVRIATNEDVLSCDYDYSVQEYAELVFGSDSEAATTELKNLLVSMLNYGAFAQNYFDVNTGALANQNLGNWGYSTTVDSSIVDDVEVRFEANANGENHALFTTNSLILESYTKLRFFFTLDADVDTSKVYMAYRLEGSDDAFSYAPLETRSGKYYGTIEDVAAAHLSDYYEVFVCVKDGDTYTQISDTKYYSAECYANTVLQKSNDEELKQAVIGMIAYGKMAKEYFGE